MSWGFRRPNPVSLFDGDVPTLLLSDKARGGDGAVRLNPEKPSAKWKWIAADSQQQAPFTVKANTSLVASLFIEPIGGDEQGHFEAATILSKVTGGAAPRMMIRPQVISPTISRYLANGPISSALLSGTAQLPGVLPSTIMSPPDTAWQFDVQNTTNSDISSQIVLWGRQFSGCGRPYLTRLMRRAQILQQFHPFWIGPKDPQDASLTGPEVTLPAGKQRLLTFPIPDNADFLMLRPLDDSSRESGGTVSITAQISENYGGRALADVAGLIPGSSGMGLDWPNFIAVTSPAVTGMSGNKINAFSLGTRAPNFWTHLIPRNTQVTILFTSTDNQPVTLRVCLFGLLIYGRQPQNRQTSIAGAAYRQRVTQGEEFLRRMGLTTEFAS